MARLTSSQIRASILERAKSVIRCPGMWSNTPEGVELALFIFLGLLLDIDKRRGDEEPYFEKLKKRGKWGPLGIAGTIRNRRGSVSKEEVAAVYEKLFMELGY